MSFGVRTLSYWIKMHRYLVETNAKGGGCFPSHTHLASILCTAVVLAEWVESTMDLTLYGRQAGRNSSVACNLSRCVP